MLLSSSDTPSMADPRVSVHLHPTKYDDSLPRTFTLSADNPVFSIGRASKRNVKQRTAEPDNGWFNSRVMSRDHAQFSLCLERKNLYICDLGSTHGTWLNNIRLIEGEKTPLISGDVLRFGITVDRGDEEFPALEVTCKIDWTQMNKWPTPPNAPAELEAPIESKPLSTLRPSCSTNTFCVPDDSDVEELPGTGPKVAEEAAAVLYPAAEVFEDPIDYDDDYCDDDDSVIEMENNQLEDLPDLSEAMDSDYAYSESSEVESDVESDVESSEPSSFSYASNVTEPKFEEHELRADDSDAEPDAESDVESKSEPESDIAIDNIADPHDGFINPDLLMQDTKAGNFALEHSSASFDDVLNPKIPVKTETSEYKPSSLHEISLEVCNNERAPHPHSVVSQDEALLSLQSDIQSAHPAAYEDGPFSCKSIGPEEPSSSSPVNSTGASLKRKACEMEFQDAQIVESVLPASQENFDIIPQPEVINAISSALAENEPPKKRSKSSHTSGTVASYTATAVVSALLGGLGTIALLAALPAEYFQ